MDPLQKEEEFHDDWASTIDVNAVLVDELATSCTSPEIQMILEALGDIDGLSILELGCGAGEGSTLFAKRGADVTATDLSSGMLATAERLAERHNVSIRTHKCSATDTGLEDASFDVVYAANLLHHVDIDATLKEVARVLKSGGTFVAWDPVHYNPLINLYRRMATEVRTDDEHPLKAADLKLFGNHFSSVSSQGTWFTTLAIFLKFYLWDRVDPNKERYWKKIVLEHEKLEPLYSPLKRFDDMILNALPFLKWMCWNMVIVATK